MNTDTTSAARSIPTTTAMRSTTTTPARAIEEAAATTSWNAEPAVNEPGSAVSHSKRFPVAVAQPLISSALFVSKNSTAATLSNRSGLSF